MEALGIEPIYLFAQIVNFAIIFFVLRKFLYKPVMTMLDNRRKEIEDGLDLAKKMETEETRLKDKETQMTADAKKQAKAIIDDAKKQLDAQKKEIIAEAHEQAAEIIAKAKAQAAQTLKDTEAANRKTAVELASAMVLRLVPQIMSTDDHRKLIATHLKDLEKQVKTVN
jgi:F-type H+-transporting ATPase subunit b